jgi:hypothetical protein
MGLFMRTSPPPDGRSGPPPLPQEERGDSRSEDWDAPGPGVPLPVETRPTETLPDDSPSSPEEACLSLESPDGSGDGDADAAAKTPTPSIIEPLPAEGSYGGWFRASLATSLSAILHLSLLIVLGAWCVWGPGDGDSGGYDLAASFALASDEALEMDDLEFESPTVETAMAEVTPDGLETLLPDPIHTADEQWLELDLPDEPRDFQSLLDAAGLGPVDLDALDAASRPGGQGSSSSGGDGSEQDMAGEAAARVGEATDVDAAFAGITGDILGEVAEGELLVVWLFDASLSLVPHRQRVATKIEEMVAGAEALGPEKARLFASAAAAFGGGVRELVRPTQKGARVASGLVDAPVDTTGVENTFSAVQWAVDRYVKRRPRRIRIVIWTDESGDDTAKLEPVIALCREKKIRVSVVGPSAVLGSQRGVQAWTLPEIGQVMYLPVLRGPDSALPERIPLPYWHRHNPWFSDGQPVPVAAMWVRPSWEVGQQLQFMVSGFGPYALTRLALATGGTYTILDNPADRGPFRFEHVKHHVPDYRSAPQILDDLRYQPLRQAVLAAVATLTAQPVAVPKMQFAARTPQQFRATLNDELKWHGARVEQSLRIIQKALVPFGPDGMETHYEAETPRWRAWYDLTRGRLLAAEARYWEYLATCQALRRELAPTSNQVMMQPAPVLKSSGRTVAVAQEAETLLRRCVEENPETPWALLAERELEHPFGLIFYQTYVPPPPPMPAMPRVPGGGPSFTVPRL